jgi:hypothetical protein
MKADGYEKYSCGKSLWRRGVKTLLVTFTKWNNNNEPHRCGVCVYEKIPCRKG